MSIGINDSGGGTLRITGWGGDEQAIVILPQQGHCSPVEQGRYRS
jgi:hypothetical protein